MIFRSFLVPFAISFCVLQNVEATLTQNDAQTRTKQISDVEYKIDLDLTQSGYNPSEDTKPIPTLPMYNGKVVVQFKALPTATVSKEFFLDFKSQEGATLKNVFVNGKKVHERWDKSDEKIFLPVSTLDLGHENKVEIEFSNRFTRNGKAFHRGLDQEDKEIYVYTNLEPFQAHEVFPMFDQPDLKAHFQLETEVPSHWTVISNTREVYKTPLNSHYTKWTFDRTEKFSTYLFALVAGPFQVWEPKEQGRIPLRLFARKTMAKYIDADDWFKMTTEAFNFFESHFGKYAYHKYDQMLVPEFSDGAMENVGAITFNEAYVSRDKMTPLQRTTLNGVITHEMAHMWFGNLVTMQWWDDLWLNESFASFMSALAGETMQDSLQLLNPWEAFFSRRKPAAYQTDGYHTTHPIVVPVDNTDMASSIFDQITYGKGASVLKQLYFYVGKENFFNGVRLYLDQFRFQNATRDDFMNAISIASGLNLNTWSDEWLSTKGTNSIQVSLTEKNGKIEKLVLIPFADPMDHKFRTHRTQIGLYYFNSEGKIVLRKLIPVTYRAEPVEIQSVVGTDAPVFVFGNAQDFDFSHEVLDSRNLENLRLHLVKIEDSLLKQQIYLSLWNMVQNAELPASEFVDLLLKNSFEETNANTLTELFASLHNALSYVHPSERLHVNEQISEFLLNKLKVSKVGSTEQATVFKTFLGFAKSPQHVALVASWFNGDATVKGINVTQDMRWRLLTALARNNYLNIAEMIETESVKDKSNLGQLSAKVAAARIATVENKKVWFNQLMTPKQFSNSESRTIAPAFHDILDESLTSFVEEQYFDALLHLTHNNENGVKIGDLASVLYPVNPSSRFASKAIQFLDVYSVELFPKVKRTLLDRLEDSRRIQKALSH